MSRVVLRFSVGSWYFLTFEGYLGWNCKVCHVSHFASRIQGWSPANRWPNDPAAGGGFNVSGLMVWYGCLKHTEAGIVTGSYLFRLKRKGNTRRGGMKETSQWDLNLHGFWYLRNDLYNLYKQKRYLQLLMTIPIFTTMTPQANKFSWKMSICLQNWALLTQCCISGIHPGVKS